MSITTRKLTSHEYQENFRDIHPAFSPSKAIAESNRCLFCFDAPCIKACPTLIDIPKFIKQISSDNIKGSAHTIMSANILGAGCARVCPTEKLCESTCVMHALGEDPIPIGRLQRYSTDQMLEKNWTLFERKNSSGKKAAVIGAGPAGLSCAHALSREGVDVDILEKEAKGGGLMTFGIAGYKVTPEFCQSELDYILSLGGINIHYKKALGEGITLDELQRKYDAVFIAIGLGRTRTLNIPGENLGGVLDALSFIYDVRTKEPNKIPIGDKVVVVGMGMTAIDAARQSKRLGASEVTLVYRRTRDEMPATEKEYRGALADGCSTLWLTSPLEIKGENKRVDSLICQKMQLAEPDELSRRKAEPTGETLTLDTDMVIKALGQTPLEGLFGSIDLKNENGRLVVDENRQTSNKQIFAGGDCINGGKEVVDAVQDGKLAARGILDYLERTCRH